MPVSAPSASTHTDRLDIHKLADTERSQLAAVTAELYAAKRKPRVGLYKVIDEATPALDLTGKCSASIEISRKHCGSEPASGLVRQLHRLRITGYDGHSRHGAKGFLLKNGHSRAHIRQGPPFGSVQFSIFFQFQ